ncbi:MAG: polyphosphate polymerase domain-containing protein [Candidatus Marinimicrobia bacterium]|nr:polyphosphate polymerase domain-containing protein [Candidatus Neomarinimicrobiota bacterium]
MSRLEYKYLFHNSIFDRLKSKLDFFIIPDYYGGHRREEYIVRSIYYDTPFLEYYYRKEAGFIIRKKIRLRGYDDYNPEKIVFFEIKRKLNDRIFKERIPLIFSDVKNFLDTGNVTKNIETNGILNIEKAKNHFLFHYYRKSLAPIALVVYDREAYFSKFDKSLRITFDKNLRAKLFPVVNELFSDSDLEFVMKNYFILEVKFYNSLPEYLVKILGEISATRLALSKYVMSIDKLKGKDKLLFLPEKIINHGRIACRF